MTGNFYELGPWRVTPSLRQNINHLELQPNPGSWNRRFGLLFLDNPIGTGFSIASTPEEIPTDQQAVAKHLFVAIRKFIGLDPSFKSRPIYITGESYAGKYVPSIGYYILKRNPVLPHSERVNLHGLAIGNGLTDPGTQVSTHALHYYNLGLINEKQKIHVEKLQSEVMKLIEAENWSDACDARSNMFQYLQNVSGLPCLYDFRRDRDYDSNWVVEFLKSAEVKKALGVNESMVFEECSDAVGDALRSDVVKSVRFMVEYVVKRTKVLVYQGQCDLMDGVVAAESWLKKMEWEGIQKFLDAKRCVWKVKHVLAGYVQKSDNLSHVVVLGAGHFVPTDQGVHSQAMIEDWILDREFIPPLSSMESTPLNLLLLLFFFLIYSAASTIPKEALPTKSGYLPVNSTTGSAIFYAFYEAQQHPTNNTSLSQTPIVIWLQGGPGCSSMTGNFYELGPWQVAPSGNQTLELRPNPGSWNRIFGLLFLDNPIGTGFSIASTPEEIPTDQDAVARHLFVAITKFIGLDPLFKSRPIYITGESYAGKYVPSIGYYILKRNPLLPVSKRVNLHGLAIGNGLTHPETQVGTHALHTYYLGLINQNQKTQLEKLQLEAIRLTKAGNWSNATYARTNALRYLQNVTGLATLYDFRRYRAYDGDWVVEFLKDPEVKKALGVNESMVYEECSDVVGAALHSDVMKSVKFMVEYLVENTKVLLYQGQCDLRDGVVSVESWMKKMKWEGLQKFLDADKEVWKVNGVLAGYVQKSDNLSHVVVLGAGHYVPTDQGVNSQAMIEDWVLNRGFFLSSMESTPLNLLLLLFLIYSAASTIPKDALPTKSGYLPVNATTGSAIFYAFYEAQQHPTNHTSLSQTPVLIWLQGGPGCSSMTGNFYELGPWRVAPSLNQTLQLRPNPGSWNRIFGLLFLDNPIGTGFSIASTPEEIPTDQEGVARHLFVAITKFIGLDPLFKSRPIYITGESYAGKYVPSIGYYILKRNLVLPVSKRVNLHGLAIGNGLTDPETQVGTYALHSYYLGLINEKQKTQLEKLQLEAIRLTKAGNWSDAKDAKSNALRYLQNMTGLATLYDFRRYRDYDSNWVVEFLKDPEVKKALGVNESMVYEECSDVVGAALYSDVMKSVRFKVEYLVKNTKVLLYQGQCDLRDGVFSVESWMKKMKWEGLQKFLDTEKEVWKVNGVLAGYVQKSDNLSHVVVLAAGHFVPTDQGVNSQAMIEDWVLDRGLYANKNIHKPSMNL
ncbi:hypothetical protein OSB04_021589 [Centaurea solstitialis]|uniref:Carboxypeptidase n=1 Tax=Centaurea solstitialis TaxID=347529 RepID=A0AA38T7V2_9ASTR|nr:hypothetical protein OSB04_021589 [Centaurea solstitialis]